MAVGQVKTFCVIFDLLACVHARGKKLAA